MRLNEIKASEGKLPHYKILATSWTFPDNISGISLQIELNKRLSKNTNNQQHDLLVRFSTWLHRNNNSNNS